ncbi:hypothetical protein SMC59_003528 [Cronobacter sakazakii]|nr:hypothetical protein [Cronobacter sakazakii]
MKTTIQRLTGVSAGDDHAGIDNNAVLILPGFKGFTLDRLDSNGTAAMQADMRS